MPDLAEPEVEPWTTAVLSALTSGEPGETVLVGHSVGCRAALRAVEQLSDGMQLRGLLLVAAWWDVGDPWPSLLPWQALAHDTARVHAAAGTPLVLLSDDDPFASDWQRNRDSWVERLAADVRVHPGARHFNQPRAPAVLAAVRELLDR